MLKSHGLHDFLVFFYFVLCDPNVVVVFHLIVLACPICPFEDTELVFVKEYLGFTVLYACTLCIVVCKGSLRYVFREGVGLKKLYRFD